MQVASALPDEDLLALDECLRQLAAHYPLAARLVELRYFAGLKHTEAAVQLGISRSAADRLWLLARAWLYARMRMPQAGEADPRHGP